jgi:cbb3-type cytochrome oxidase subunit 3
MPADFPGLPEFFIVALLAFFGWTWWSLWHEHRQRERDDAARESEDERGDK